MKKLIMIGGDPKKLITIAALMASARHYGVIFKREDGRLFAMCNRAPKALCDCLKENSGEVLRFLEKELDDKETQGVGRTFYN